MTIEQARKYFENRVLPALAEVSKSYCVVTGGEVTLNAYSGHLEELAYAMGATFADMLEEATTQEQWEYLQQQFAEGFKNDTPPVEDEGGEYK
jgi:hypothetical protein